MFGGLLFKKNISLSGWMMISLQFHVWITGNHQPVMMYSNEKSSADWGGQLEALHAPKKASRSQPVRQR
jgi:hypothetical protein